ncbi:hypothetical protein SS209_01719 [Salmonella enterica subsp. enterica serovar Senftenberg str. SS209]|nr:hypothetical protein SS209_01719 [Salmonella enterica subsp. enterica serovar Senftenberg str. SS209]
MTLLPDLFACVSIAGASTNSSILLITSSNDLTTILM